MKLSIKKQKMLKIPRFCKSCGKKLLYDPRNGSEDNGWNKFEVKKFDSFTGKRKRVRYIFEVKLFCPSWNEYLHTIPRQQSPRECTTGYFDCLKMFDLKKYGLIPTIHRNEDDIICGLPRNLYIETYKEKK